MSVDPLDKSILIRLLEYPFGMRPVHLSKKVFRTAINKAHEASQIRRITLRLHKMEKRGLIGYDECANKKWWFPFK